MDIVNELTNYLSTRLPGLAPCVVLLPENMHPHDAGRPFDLGALLRSFNLESNDFAYNAVIGAEIGGSVTATGAGVSVTVGPHLLVQTLSPEDCFTHKGHCVKSYLAPNLSESQMREALIFALGNIEPLADYADQDVIIDILSTPART